MKRTIGEINRLEEDGIELNVFGHVPATDKEDMRPGWLRDEEAGLSLSRLQKIQKKFGWVTIANTMSLSRPPLAALGMGLLATGNHLEGVTALTAAALSDAEGKPARLTGTDDPKNGAMVDAISDGAAAGVIGIGAVAINVMPLGSMLAMYAPKAINAVTAGLAKREHLKHYTDKVDKAVEVGRWLTAGMFVADYVNLLNLDWGSAAEVGVAAVALGGVVSSIRQIMRYRRTRRNR